MSECPYPEPDWESYPTAICMTFDCLGGHWATAYWERPPRYNGREAYYAMSPHEDVYLGGESYAFGFDLYYVEPYMIMKEAVCVN